MRKDVLWRMRRCWEGKVSELEGKLSKQPRRAVIGRGRMTKNGYMASFPDDFGSKRTRDGDRVKKDG